MSFRPCEFIRGFPLSNHRRGVGKGIRIWRGKNKNKGETSFSTSKDLVIARRLRFPRPARLNAALAIQVNVGKVRVGSVDGRVRIGLVGVGTGGGGSTRVVDVGGGALVLGHAGRDGASFDHDDLALALAAEDDDGVEEEGEEGASVDVSRQ